MLPFRENGPKTYLCTRGLNVQLEKGLLCDFFKCLQTQKASIQETTKLANAIINSSVW